MGSSQPVIKQVSFVSLIPQILVLFALVFIFYVLNLGDPVLMGAGSYLVISFIVRRFIPIYHRNGMRYFRARDYEKARKQFEKSYVFFKEHEWIDKYRFIVLLSSSRVSYREMALINIAFCYGQLGNGKMSKEYYEKTLMEFPESQMAVSALKMYDAARNMEHLEKDDI
jgi:tetratricopeptide (TPR) repeat protein